MRGWRRSATVFGA